MSETPVFQQTMADVAEFYMLLAQAEELDSEDVWLSLLAMQTRTILSRTLPHARGLLATLFGGPFAGETRPDASYRYYGDPENGLLEVDVVHNNGLVGVEATRVAGTRVLSIQFRMRDAS